MSFTNRELAQNHEMLGDVGSAIVATRDLVVAFDRLRRTMDKLDDRFGLLRGELHRLTIGFCEEAIHGEPGGQK